MDKLTELEQRINEYRRHAFAAEKAALQKLATYPPFDRPLSESEVLRRELFRHHTRTLLLDEIKQWIAELRTGRLYQLCILPDHDHPDTQVYKVRQHMTEKEVAEVNALFEASHERLRWIPIEASEDAEE